MRLWLFLFWIQYQQLLFQGLKSRLLLKIHPEDWVYRFWLRSNLDIVLLDGTWWSHLLILFFDWLIFELWFVSRWHSCILLYVKLRSVLFWLSNLNGLSEIVWFLFQFCAVIFVWGLCSFASNANSSLLGSDRWLVLDQLSTCDFVLKSYSEFGWLPQIGVFLTW